jgi:phosphomannomutase
LSVGCDVLDVGLVPTPTVELKTAETHNIGGIIITASHNPKEWNALKLLSSDGQFINPEQSQKILNRIKEQKIDYMPWNKMGSIYHDQNVIDQHVQKISDIKLINTEMIRKRHFKIVVDCVNGAGGTILPKLFDSLNCDVYYINKEPTGIFTKNPEPRPENLTALSQLVLTQKADLGIAVDPDVDRLAIVSNNGEPLGEEYTLALVTDFILSKNPGNVVINVSTSRVIDDIAKKYNQTVYRTPVGEFHVAQKAKRVNAVIAGEGNGGVMYPAIHTGRDASVGIALLLQYLAETKQTIDQAFANLPHYHMIKDKISIPFGTDAKNILQKIEEKYSSETIDKTDGIKVLYENSWFQVRASNTEPIIRIMTESPTESESKKWINSVKDLITSV